MFDRLPHEPPLEERDVTEYLRYVWDEVSLLNMQLSAHVTDAAMTSEEKRREQRLLDEFTHAHFGINWLERNATLVAGYTAFTPSESTEANDVMSVTHATFLGCTIETRTEHCAVDPEARTVIEIARKVVALVLKVDKHNYTLPLDHQSNLPPLLTVALERPAEVEATFTDELKNHCRVARHFLHTSSFLSKDLETQIMLVDRTIMDIEFTLGFDDLYQDTSVIVRYRDIYGIETERTGCALHLELPGLHERQTAYRQSSDFAVGELCVKITATDGAHEEYLPASRIIDISDQPDIDALTDILNSVFHDATQRIIADAEASLQHEPSASYDMAVDETTEELRTLMPDGFFDQAFHIAGAFFYEPGDREGEIVRNPHLENTNHASVECFVVKRFSGAPRILLQLEIPTAYTFINDEGDEEIVTECAYVIPTPGLLTAFKLQIDDGEQMYRDDT